MLDTCSNNIAEFLVLILSNAYLSRRQGSRIECFLFKKPNWPTCKAWLWLHHKESREKVSLLLYCCIKGKARSHSWDKTSLQHLSSRKLSTTHSSEASQWWASVIEKCPATTEPSSLQPSPGRCSEAWQEGCNTKVGSSQGRVLWVGWVRLCQQVCAVTQLIPPPCWAG